MWAPTSQLRLWLLLNVKVADIDGIYLGKSKAPWHYLWVITKEFLVSLGYWQPVWVVHMSGYIPVGF